MQTGVRVEIRRLWSSTAGDLTALAEEGKLDPVVGREQEIERIMEILSRRTKNNPCLVGEPGVEELPLWKVWPSGSPWAQFRLPYRTGDF